MTAWIDPPRGPVATLRRELDALREVKRQRGPHRSEYIEEEIESHEKAIALLERERSA